jgi:hypothetical protein
MKLLRPNGYMNWVMPLMVAFAAIAVLLSGRDLSMMFAQLAGAVDSAPGPAFFWVQRAITVVLLLICGERIARHFGQHQSMPSPGLACAFVLLWIGTVASPALLGAHKSISHEYTYTLVIGFAALLVTTQEIGKIVDTARDTLFVLMLASVLLVPVWPSLVLDESYTQGLLPGVPRLGGLAPHPVALGMFAQTALVLLWARPYGRRWFNVLAWGLGLGVLFFAQSKTSWIAFLLCAITMVAVRHVPNAWRRIGDPREGAFGIFVCLLVMVLGAAVLAVVLFADIGGEISDFLSTEQGAQLTTLTGRDQIWAIAWQEFHSNPWFGYGPTLFDEDFRQSINMPQATHGHNQFLDTLARSGVAGVATLVVYAVVLMVLSFKYGRRTGGLSIALFIALALRSVSEVPLMLFGYGTEFFTHLLLVVTLSAAASMRVPAAAPRPRPAWGVPA